MILIGDIDHIPGATVLSATTEATGHDADNTLNRRRALTWRSTSIATTQRVAWDLGSSKDISAVAVLTNGLPGGTITLDVGDDSSFVTTEYDTSELIVPSGAPTGRGTARRTVPWVHTFAQVNSRYVRVGLLDTDHQDGYHEIEVAMVGKALALPDPPRDWTQQRALAGDLLRRRRWELVLRPLSMEQLASVEDLAETLGSFGRLLVVPAETHTKLAHRETLYGRIAEDGLRTEALVRSRDRYQARLVLEEVLD